MSHVHYHSQSSARRFGGRSEDYGALHAWFDATKIAWCDSRHRALRHHQSGIAWAVLRFGERLQTSDGNWVGTEEVCRQHLLEDCGYVPTLRDWFREWDPPSWSFQGPDLVRLSLRLGCPERTLRSVADYLLHPPLAETPDQPDAPLALRCHSFGAFEAEVVLGSVLRNPEGRQVPTRVVAEQIIADVCGARVPCVSDWLSRLPKRRWMNPGYRGQT